MFLNIKNSIAIVCSIFVLCAFSHVAHAINEQASDLAKAIFDHANSYTLNNVKTLIKTTDDANQVLEMAVNQAYKTDQNHFMLSEMREEKKQADLINLALEEGAQFSAINLSTYHGIYLPSVEAGHLMLKNPANPQNILDKDKFISLIIKASCKEYNYSTGIYYISDKLLEQRRRLLDLTLNNQADANKLLESAIKSSYEEAESIDLIRLALVKGAKFYAITIDYLSYLPSIELASLMLKNPTNPQNILDKDKFISLIIKASCKEYNSAGISYVSDKLLEQRRQLLELVLDNKVSANKLLESTLNSLNIATKPIDLINLALAKGAKFSAINIDYLHKPMPIELATLILENKPDPKNVVNPNKFLKLVSTISCLKYDDTTKKNIIDADLSKQRDELIALAVSKGATADKSTIKNEDDDDDNWRNTEKLTEELYTLFGIEVYGHAGNHEPATELEKCTPAELNKAIEQIAKIHIITVLMNSRLSSHTILLRNNQIIINHPSLDLTNTTAEVKEFYKLINPRENPYSARIFSYPYSNYTVANNEQLIEWLNKSWDEAKVETMIKTSNIKDADKIFNLLKLRLQNLKILLSQVKQYDYKLYDTKKIEQRRIQLATLTRNFDAANISYKVKSAGSLPIAMEQILFCYNKSETWLELTNYEFLINGKESNKLVTIYFGKSAAEAQKTAHVTKQPLEIFDPESVFIFQDAFLHCWSELQCLSKNNKRDAQINLVKAIQAGYDALNHHFGFKKSLRLDMPSISIATPKDLAKFIQTNHDDYKIQALSINRYVTAQDLADKAKLGFVAYYPNPIYLHDLAWYVRPDNMSYDEYKLYGQSFSSFFAENPEALLAKNIPREHNEYSDILKRIYPTGCTISFPDNKPCQTEKSCPKKKIDEEYVYSDMKSLTYENFKLLDPSYVFRGDDRPLEDIAKAKGFDSPVTRGCEAVYDPTMEKVCAQYGLDGQKIKDGHYDTKKLMERVKNIDDFWKFRENGIYLYTDKAYVSASKNIRATKSFGANTYALFTKKGIEIPSFLEKENDASGYHFEVVVPLHVDFADIAGTRTNDKDRLSIGPIFIRSNLATKDVDNFWKMVQIFGGKSQTKEINVQQEARLIKSCEDAFSDFYTQKANNCEKIFTVMGAETITANAACFANDVTSLESCALPKTMDLQIRR